MKKIDKILSYSFLILTVCQAAAGLAARDIYRDIGWIKATWLGNDIVSLFVIVPILLISIQLAKIGSARAELVRLGGLAYGVYNYSFYLFGAALNAFFPLYVFSFLVSVAALIFGLVHLDTESISKRFSSRTPVRILGGYYTFIAMGLSIIWFGIWAAYIFAGRPTPVETEAFKIVASLDTIIIIPALISGGVLLWRRNRWGFVIAGIAGVQASLYLLVLLVNSIIAIKFGFAEFPGELPIWGILTSATLAITCRLFFYNKPATNDENNTFT
jgi:hypothetical protein